MKKRIRIVFLDRGTFPKTIKMPKPQFSHEWIQYDHSTSAQVVKRSQGAQVIITNKVPITREAIEKLPSLELISVSATGTNNINHEACKERHITVKNVINYGTDSVAEHTLCLILNLFRQFLPYRESILNNKWPRSKIFSYFLEPVKELSQSRLSIIGPGVLGRRVGELATAFKMDTVYVGNPGSNNQKKFPHLKFVSLTQALKTSDVISIHCPLNQQTQNLITLKELQKMKPTAFLVNTSRGGIVNEEDLAWALKKRLIQGAAFDVLTTEPPPKKHVLHRLRSHPQFILTPHMAWVGQDSINNLLSGAIANVEKFYHSHHSKNHKKRSSK